MNIIKKIVLDIVEGIIIVIALPIYAIFIISDFLHGRY